MRWRGLAAVIVLTTLTACAPGGLGSGTDANGTDDTGGPTTTFDVEVDTTTTAGEPAPRPDVGECRGPMTYDMLDAPTDDRPTVDCDGPHGTEVVAVIDLPERWDYDDAQEIGVTPSDGGVEATTECSDRVRQFIDDRQVDPGDAAVIPGHSLGPTFYIPTDDEWDEGARWLRCDATLFPPPDAPERATASTIAFEGAAGGPVIDASLRLCSDFLEGGAAELPCSEAHVREFMAFIFDPDVDPGALTGLVDEESWQLAARPAAETQCAAAVIESVGAERADVVAQVLVPTLDVATEQAATFEFVSYDCWARTLGSDGRPAAVTGTVQGIGTGPLPG